MQTKYSGMSHIHLSRFVTLQCHFNQPRPFSHYRAKEASDFDGHRFTERFSLRQESLYTYFETIRSRSAKIPLKKFCLYLQLLIRYTYHSFTPLRAFIYSFLYQFFKINLLFRYLCTTYYRICENSLNWKINIMALSIYQICVNNIF